jgi:multidrug efflux pump subunit AcrA (membrane-fusion protein)
VRLQGRGTARTLLVDEKSVLTDQDRKYVYIAKDGKATRRDVELGRSVGRFRMVEKGLAEGDRVIVSGVQRVRPDMPIAPQLIQVTDPDAPTKDGAPPAAPGEPAR